MKMNFDVLPARRGTFCEKWDGMSDAFGVTPGEDLLPLWVADMDFACAPEILAAVHGAYENGTMGYRRLAPAFQESVVHWMQTRHALTVDPAWILPIPGVVAGISSSIASFTEAGDGVIVQPPIYPPFVNVTRNMGRTVLENPLIEREENGTLYYDVDFDGLRRLAARPDAKMLVLCSPHNPTGRVFTAEELREICAICAENGVYIVSDEIHSDIILGDTRFTPILSAAQNAHRVCQLGSPSKSFNTAGTHSAYMIVPDADERAKLSAFWNALHIPTDSFVSAEVVSTAYGAAAYYPDELCTYLRENMAYACETLRRELPEVRMTAPEATYLLWADFSRCGIPAEKVMDTLCREARVVPDPGAWFSPACEGYLRLNVASPRAMLEEALARIIATVRAYR